MLPTSKYTAILIFSRSAAAEACEKDFSGRRCHQANVMVAHYLVNATIALAKRSLLPYYLVTENEQHGGTFGERLTNAMEDVFGRGYENIIVIGNDSPALQTSDLVDAANLLLNNPFVVKPTGKGGIALLGISNNQFNKKQLCSLPWQSPFLLGGLVQYLHNNHIPNSQLSAIDDINHHTDLKPQVFDNCVPLPLRLLFIQLIVQHIKWWLAYIFNYTPSFLISSAALRAPPMHTLIQ